jgi:multiple antibiotic resistance protein
MELAGIDLYLVFDLLLLLLIGMGPKIALVPFLELTAHMDDETRHKVAGRMNRTAVITALLLVLLGWLLMKLLHFSPGAVTIAGGIVLLLLALRMLASGAKSDDHHEKAGDRDPMQMALYPLAVPYLLNPVGIAVLVTVSGQFDSWVELLVVIGLVLLMGGFNRLVFMNLDSLAKHLDPSRMMITEAVFGVLLSALAVEMVLYGLATLGIIDLVAGH